LKERGKGEVPSWKEESFLWGERGKLETPYGIWGGGEANEGGKLSDK